MTEHHLAAIAVALREWEEAWCVLVTSAVSYTHADLTRVSEAHAALAAEVYREWE